MAATGWPIAAPSLTRCPSRFVAAFYPRVSRPHLRPLSLYLLPSSASSRPLPILCKLLLSSLLSPADKLLTCERHELGLHSFIRICRTDSAAVCAMRGASGKRQKAGERITIIREGRGEERKGRGCFSLTVCTGFTRGSHPPPHPPPSLLPIRAVIITVITVTISRAGMESAAGRERRSPAPSSPSHTLVRHTLLCGSAGTAAVCVLRRKASGQAVGSGEHFFSLILSFSPSPCVHSLLLRTHNHSH